MSEMLKGMRLLGLILEGVGGNVQDVFAEWNVASLSKILTF
jgi:hypothetical protein